MHFGHQLVLDFSSWSYCTLIKSCIKSRPYKFSAKPELWPIAVIIRGYAPALQLVKGFIYQKFLRVHVSLFKHSSIINPKEKTHSFTPTGDILDVRLTDS